MRDFGSIDLAPLPGLDRAVGHQPSWLIAMRARSPALRLDAALAAGADPCGSRPLAHRAARLTSDRTRHKMANWVAEILATPTRPPRGFSVAVEPDRGEIAMAEPLLLRVWSWSARALPFTRGGWHCSRTCSATAAVRSTCRSCEDSWATSSRSSSPPSKEASLPSCPYPARAIRVLDALATPPNILKVKRPATVQGQESETAVNGHCPADRRPGEQVDRDRGASPEPFLLLG